MGKKKNTTAITTTGRPSNALVVKRDVPVRFERRLVVAEAVYRVSALRPTEAGPWSQEADKIAWTDADSFPLRSGAGGKIEDAQLLGFRRLHVDVMNRGRGQPRYLARMVLLLAPPRIVGPIP